MPSCPMCFAAVDLGKPCLPCMKRMGELRFLRMFSSELGRKAAFLERMLVEWKLRAETEQGLTRDLSEEVGALKTQVATLKSAERTNVLLWEKAQEAHEVQKARIATLEANAAKDNTVVFGLSEDVGRAWGEEIDRRAARVKQAAESLKDFAHQEKLKDDLVTLKHENAVLRADGEQTRNRDFLRISELEAQLRDANKNRICTCNAGSSLKGSEHILGVPTWCIFASKEKNDKVGAQTAAAYAAQPQTEEEKGFLQEMETEMNNQAGRILELEDLATVVVSELKHTLKMIPEPPSDRVLELVDQAQAVLRKEGKAKPTEGQADRIAELEAAVSNQYVSLNRLMAQIDSLNHTGDQLAETLCAKLGKEGEALVANIRVSGLERLRKAQRKPVQQGDAPDVVFEALERLKAERAKPSEAPVCTEAEVKADTYLGKTVPSAEKRIHDAFLILNNGLYFTGKLAPTREQLLARIQQTLQVLYPAQPDSPKFNGGRSVRITPSVRKSTLIESPEASQAEAEDRALWEREDNTISEEEYQDWVPAPGLIGLAGVEVHPENVSDIHTMIAPVDDLPMRPDHVKGKVCDPPSSCGSVRCQNAAFKAECDKCRATVGHVSGCECECHEVRPPKAERCECGVSMNIGHECSATLRQQVAELESKVAVLEGTLRRATYPMTQEAALQDRANELQRQLAEAKAILDPIWIAAQGQEVVKHKDHWLVQTVSRLAKKLAKVEAEKDQHQSSFRIVKMSRDELETALSRQVSGGVRKDELEVAITESEKKWQEKWDKLSNDWEAVDEENGKLQSQVAELETQLDTVNRRASIRIERLVQERDAQQSANIVVSTAHQAALAKIKELEEALHCSPGSRLLLKLPVPPEEPKMVTFKGLAYDGWTIEAAELSPDIAPIVIVRISRTRYGGEFRTVKEIVHVRVDTDKRVCLDEPCLSPLAIGTMIAVIEKLGLGTSCPKCHGSGYEPNTTGESAFDGDPCSVCRLTVKEEAILDGMGFTDKPSTREERLDIRVTQLEGILNAVTEELDDALTEIAEQHEEDEEPPQGIVDAHELVDQARAILRGQSFPTPNDVRGFLVDIEQTLTHCLTIHGMDSTTERLVRNLGEHRGYGAIMDAARQLWREKLKKDGAEGGEFCAGPCVAEAERLLAEVKALLKLPYVQKPESIIGE